ncbi:MAG TPA: RAMP superfamily CRISPR-associated protein [Ktedonobacteraceae bacterium]|jgi:CRISPR/Cas system CMR subunit Cmr4 (Cas7 group RAMP superfamily)
MPEPSWSAHVSRKIVRRIVVEGDLVLQTPAHFGNGDGNGLVSMPLLTDSLNERTPLLTGASIAGALRSYVRERQHGFRARIDPGADSSQSDSVLLFGGSKGNDAGEQSPLIVEDAYGRNAAIELRDGVHLAGASRTSVEDALFTVEMWQAGTVFPLRFELVVRDGDEVSALRRALATALAGFVDGSITVGARKRRGYGQARVEGWRVREYDLTDTKDLLAWIVSGAVALDGPCRADIVQALGGSTTVDRRHMFCLKGRFSLEGSLLIRSGSRPENAQGAGRQQPEIIHLHSPRLAPINDGTREQVPVLSGTSFAGALRARALRIAQMLVRPTPEGRHAAHNLVECMFGNDMNHLPPDVQPVASRITICESLVSKGENTLVQNRVGIDRFTGGARDGALFSQQPLFGCLQTRVVVDLRLANPRECEIGLLLLVLKDLWTGDLPLGGEISVGRGRLQGRCCLLEVHDGLQHRWKLRARGATGLHVTGSQDLEHYVTQLHAHLDRSRP